MTTTLPKVSGNGHGTAVRDLDIAPRRRKARSPELLVGAALMVGFALVAVLLFARSNDKQPYLTVAGPVARGETVDMTDLRVVYLSSDQHLSAVRADQAQDLAGRAAAVDLVPGSILDASDFASVAAVASGEGVVGLSLEPGQYPVGALHVGDVMNVVSVAAGADFVVAERATVYAVDESDTQGRRLISLRTSEADANAIAVAAEQGSVRLVLMGAA